MYLSPQTAPWEGGGDWGNTIFSKQVNISKTLIICTGIPNCEILCNPLDTLSKSFTYSGHNYGLHLITWNSCFVDKKYETFPKKWFDLSY